MAAKAAPALPSSRHHYLQLVKSDTTCAEVFFLEIEDPTWIKDLESERFFDVLPQKVLHDNGSVTYPRSLEIQGLTRLAPRAPVDVARIIARLPETDNFNVGDQILRCMVEITDPDCVSLLLPVAKRLTDSTNHSSRLFLRELVKSWVSMGCVQDALEIMEVFVTAVASTETMGRGDHQISWEFEESDREILQPLTDSHPSAIAKICFNGLRAYYDACLEGNPDRIDPVSRLFGYSLRDELDLAHWLEDFTKADRNREDPRAILTNRLYLATGVVFRKFPAEGELLDEHLRDHPWLLFKRLRWQTYADYPQETLALSRRDAISTIPSMNRKDHLLRFEFASMLTAHALEHGGKFLTPAEVQWMVEVVRTGPIDSDGSVSQNAGEREIFWHQQLWPIYRLLPDEVRAQLDRWATNSTIGVLNLGLERYKPIRRTALEVSGFVDEVSPYPMSYLKNLRDSEIFDLLNDWSPSGRTQLENFTEFSVRKLASEFARLIESQPDRFVPSTKWWRMIRRPVIFSVVLDYWTARLSPEDRDSRNEVVSEVDFSNAFGVMEWIIISSQDLPEIQGSSEDSCENPDWRGPRLASSRFLKAFVRANSPINPWSQSVRDLLSSLATGSESRLDQLSSRETEEESVQDWQFEAINSIRGTVWEAIILLALKERNSPTQGSGTVSQWIPKLLTERLSPDIKESPAVFSLLGSQLRLLVYVLQAWTKTNAHLLLPSERIECHNALIDGHLLYDQPHKFVIETIPDLLDSALDLISRRTHTLPESPNLVVQQPDISSRLGFHLAFYAWNDWFSMRDTAHRALLHYRTIADPRARAETLGYIGSVFEATDPVERIEPLLIRAMEILEDWLRWIEDSLCTISANSAAFDAELGQFADLIAAECFPFSWRVDIAFRALNLSNRPRRSYQFVDTLQKWAEEGDDNPERLSASIRLLAALTRKLSDEHRWSIQSRKISPIIRKGLVHVNPELRALTNEALENLLRCGFYDLLDLVEKSE